MWIFYTLASAVCEVGKDITGKKSSLHINELLSSFSLQFFGALVLLPLVIFTGIPEIKPHYWGGLLVTFILNPLWSLLYVKALKMSPLSVSIPMLAFNPVFTALFSIIFDKHLPNIYGWIGIILVCIGLYLMRLDRDGFRKGVFYPLRKLGSEPGAIAMLGVGLIWSLGAHINKVIVDASSPLFFAFSATTVGALGLLILAKLTGQFSLKELKKNVVSLGLLGTFNGLSEISLGAALVTGYTPFVIAIKRISILGSTVAGVLFFGEKMNKIKTVGVSLMFAGVLFIIVLQ